LRKENSILQNIDWQIVVIYLVLVVFGWLNIYAAVYNEEHKSIFDLSQNYGKQMIWILTSFVIALGVLVVDGKFYPAFSYPMYLLAIFMLLLVYLFAPEVKGAKSWLEIGSFKLQPSEFAKFATNMAIAKYLSTMNIRMQDPRTKFITFSMIIVPIAFILLQNDTGSALVYFSFIFVLYREGLSGNVLLLGFLGALLFVLALLIDKVYLISVIGIIAFFFFMSSRKKWQNIVVILAFAALASGVVFSVGFVFENVLEPHQKKRIEVLLGKEEDLRGAGYNVNQSKIAIGSGGFFGKGFLEGTQTKFAFVPEQSTDFIFCTVGEEWGFFGSIITIGLFALLITRIIIVAERQRSTYTRIYGYGVASILFFHLMINIGMTLGLAPVIGIPLPFLSYGGSSLYGFTILLFIFVKLDSYRLMVLR
jgi:rod shape determining protein RodA